MADTGQVLVRFRIGRPESNFVYTQIADAVWECCRGVSDTPGEPLLYIVDPKKAALESGFLCCAFLLAKKRLE